MQGHKEGVSRLIRNQLAHRGCLKPNQVQREFGGHPKSLQVSWSMLLGFHFRSALFLLVVEYYMGESLSKPEETPLECILKNWKFFEIRGLKREKFQFYYSSAWPLSNLGNREK